MKSINKNENGMVLLSVLVLVLVLTLIVVSSIGTNLLNVKMLSNKQDKMIAFNSAEMAVHEAENNLKNLTTTSQFNVNGDGGYYTYDPNYNYQIWNNVNWNNNQKVITGTDYPSRVASPPKYIIEKISQISQNADNLNISNYGSSISSDKTVVFRITAYGTGIHDNVHAIIQTTYGVKM